METYKAWQVAASAVRETKAWLANKDKIDSQCRQPYSLTSLKVSAEYCGQSSPGANNYHKSPVAFNDALADVIKSNFEQLSNKALERLERTEKARLIECKSDLSKVLESIEIAEAENESPSDKSGEPPCNA